jgi:hypothetical protein
LYFLVIVHSLFYRLNYNTYSVKGLPSTDYRTKVCRTLISNFGLALVLTLGFVFLRAYGPMRHTFRCGRKMLGTKNFVQCWHCKHDEFFTHFLYSFNCFSFYSACSVRFYKCLSATDKFLLVSISSCLLLASNFRLSKIKADSTF